MPSVKILHGDCVELMRAMEEGSVDAVVTDPPAGISFMSKEWDHDKGGRSQWVAWMTGVMRECLRVLKPGGHAVVWAIPRTAHWTGWAIEDAGFDVRDVITHLFGSGFPKSHNVAAAIDKSLGHPNRGRAIPDCFDVSRPATKMRSINSRRILLIHMKREVEEAKKWEGFGTALKPATEFWILARKPMRSANGKSQTVAKNVLEHGTGALNIDACRIGY